MKLRLLTQDDYSSVCEIERAAAVRFPPGRIPDPTDTVSSETLADAIASNLAFGVDIQDVLVGFAIASLQGSHVHLTEMDVHPDFGQRGLGALLLDAILNAAVVQNAAGVTLTTFSDLPWNAPFYAKAGFVEAASETIPTFLRRRLLAEADAGLKNRIAMIRPR